MAKMNEDVCIFCLTVIVQLILWITRPRLMDGFAMFCIRVLGGIGLLVAGAVGIVTGFIAHSIESIMGGITEE